MDLTDEQWDIIQPLIPEPPKRPLGRGRPRRDNREILNGILWIMRTGHNGKICRTGTRRTRPATGGSRNGFAWVCLKTFCEPW